MKIYYDKENRRLVYFGASAPKFLGQSLGNRKSRRTQLKDDIVRGHSYY